MRKGTAVVCLVRSKIIKGLPELPKNGILKGGYIIPEPEPPELVQIKLQKKTAIETIKFYLEK
nr:MAG TPA: hypothetical protein [Caudoviricetes sp.]